MILEYPASVAINHLVSTEGYLLAERIGYNVAENGSINLDLLDIHCKNLISPFQFHLTRSPCPHRAPTHHPNCPCAACLLKVFSRSTPESRLMYFMYTSESQTGRYQVMCAALFSGGCYAQVPYNRQL